MGRCGMLIAGDVAVPITDPGDRAGRADKMAIAMAVSAYCGKYTHTEREHVISQRRLHPRDCKLVADRVCVPACSRCNRGFSADESEFRGFAVLIDALAGDTSVKDALFHGPV